MLIPVMTVAENIVLANEPVREGILLDVAAAAERGVLGGDRQAEAAAPGVVAAIVLGAVASVICYFAVSKLKPALGYDDALDTFGVHGVGGTLGAILAGVFADPAINSALEPLMDGLLVAQLKAVAVTVVWSVVATAIIAYLVKALIGLRPTPEVERQGLDINEHGEEGYVD